MNSFITFYENVYKDNPLVLIDVGASGGIKENWKAVEAYLKVIGFEPDSRGLDSIVNKDSARITHFNSGLYKESGVKKLYLTKHPDASSVLLPNRKFLDKFYKPEDFQIIESHDINVDTLDNILDRNNVKADFLKLDTQGSELDILRGGANSLKNGVVGIEIEVNFSERYQGQPFFSDIDLFLRDFGFEFFDLQPRYWKRAVGIGYGDRKGQLTHGNALYFKNIEKFEQSLLAKNNSDKKISVLKYILAVVLYGYLDYAIEIFNRFDYLFSQEEKSLFSGFVEKQTPFSQKIPNFKGRYKLAKLFSFLYDFIKPKSISGRSGGEYLGNRS